MIELVLAYLFRYLFVAAVPQSLLYVLPCRIEKIFAALPQDKTEVVW